MREMTKKFLQEAFAGESQAHMKYLIFADQAEKEGFSEVAKLFRAIAYAERVHAENHLRALNGGATVENLQKAIEGENYEVQEMYPAFKATADLQGENQASRSFTYALEAEKIHAALFEEAKEAIKTGRDVEPRKIYVCQVCGHTAVGKVPDRCPVCSTPGNNFKEF